MRSRVPRSADLRLIAGFAEGGPEPTVAAVTPESALGRPLRVADVAMFYGERSGGIRTYLEAKSEFARRTGAFEHHLVVPGRREQESDAGRHIQPSVRLAASNGYRIPLGSAGLLATLRAIRPDVVLLHDPFWTPRLSCRSAHERGGVVIAVHHASAALHAAGIPGPQELYKLALRRWYRRAYLDVDAVMSVVDPEPDVHRPSTLRLRLGLHTAFGPQTGTPRGDHVLYAGRLAREKGLRELLDAAAASPEPWRLVLRGTGPLGDLLQERVEQLGLVDRVSFAPYISDRAELAAEYARARCVVLPGPHETFGLAALEAAACGAPVVTAVTTPAARLIAGSVHTFDAGDRASLLRAINRARRSTPSIAAAQRLALEHNWDAELRAELADVTELVLARRGVEARRRRSGRRASTAVRR